MAVKIPYDIPLKGLKTKRTEAKETQKNEARRESRKRLIQKISMTCRCMYVFFSGLNPDLSVTFCCQIRVGSFFRGFGAAFGGFRKPGGQLPP